MSELENFLKDLGASEESIVDKPLVEPPAPEKEGEDNEEKVFKNRYTRRKEQEAQRLRDEVSQLTERVKILSEADKLKQDVGDDYKKLLEPIFGTAGEDGKYDPKRELATKNLIAAFEGMKESVKKEFFADIESRQGQETEAQKEADSEVDEFLEIAEDEGIDVSDDNVRSGLITLMERMSKKYEDGNIKEFADNEAVIETFKELQKRQDSSKARELASRSMTRSGESQPSKLPQNAIDRFMEENGLTGSW